jgi:hypothetical protein
MALFFAACGDSGSSIDALDDATAATSGGDLGGGGDDGGGLFGSDETIPITVGNIPGLSNECEALVNVFLAFTNVFSGGQIQAPSLDVISGLPGDLQADAAIMIETMQAYADGLQELGIDLSDPLSFSSLTEEQQMAFGELSEAFDTEEFNAASERLSAYGEAECDQFVPGG